MPPDPLLLIRKAKAEKKKAPLALSCASDALPPLELPQRCFPPPAVPLATMPSSAQYFPDFVSETDEETLLQHILNAPTSRWSPGNNRRTQNWGGKPGERKVAEELPVWLLQLTEALVRSGAWPADEPPPNHVIINDYETPGAGLTPHTDGPLYADRVATLSLMSNVVIELHRPEEASVKCEPETRLGRLLLRRRSLNVLSGDAYRCFHGIRWADSDTIDADVANLDLAGGDEAIGEEVRRARRVSIVFVCKL